MQPWRAQLKQQELVERLELLLVQVQVLELVLVEQPQVLALALEPYA